MKLMRRYSGSMGDHDWLRLLNYSADQVLLYIIEGVAIASINSLRVWSKEWLL